MRTFIAFSVPDDAVAQIVQWQQENLPPGVFPEPASNLHLTLAFLGETPDELVPQINQILSRLNPSSVSITGPVEYREQDKLAFLAYQEQGGTAVWEQLNAELKSLTGYVPQFQPWLPHTTIWRYAPDHKPNINPPLPSINFTPTAVTLYQSVKNPAGGANYVKVGKTPYYYHLAPTSERARIQAYGLQPGKPVPHTKLIEKQPSGVYAFSDLDTALNYSNGKNDIWRIPISQIQEQKPDPLVFNAVVIPHAVDPELYVGYEDRVDWPKVGAGTGYRDQYDDEREAKVANILDPISKTLDQRVFNGIKPRPDVVSFIEDKFYRTINELYVDNSEEYFDLVLTGSLTTYQYGDTSDCDISVFVHYDGLSALTGKDSGDIRRDLIHLVTTELDGSPLPGSGHPLQFFIIPPDQSLKNYFAPGIRSGWSFNMKGWIVPPEKSRAHDIASEMPELYHRAQMMADKLTTLLDAHDEEGARAMFAQIHKKRNEDEANHLGDFSEGNIVYKYLLHDGLFDRLRSEADVHIASFEKYTAPEYSLNKITPENKIPILYDFDRDRIIMSNNYDFHRGSRIIGEYDGKDAYLHGASKQWINPNYFKRLWVATFPQRPLNKVHMDGAAIETRPADAMTYTQKLPFLVHNSAAARAFIYDPDTDKIYVGQHHGQILTTFSDLAHKFNEIAPDDWGMYKYLTPLVPGWKMGDNPPEIYSDYVTSHASEEAGQRAIQKANEYFSRTAKSPWKDGSKWKTYIKNEGIIVDFQVGDENDDPVEGKVIEIDSDSIRIELSNTERRTFDNDFLHQIKFRVRDEKKSLSFWKEARVDVGDCAYPDCDYDFTPEDEKDIALAHDWFHCPQCNRTYNLKNTLDEKTSTRVQQMNEWKNPGAATAIPFIYDPKTDQLHTGKLDGSHKQIMENIVGDYTRFPYFAEEPAAAFGRYWPETGDLGIYRFNYTDEAVKQRAEQKAQDFFDNNAS